MSKGSKRTNKRSRRRRDAESNGKPLLVTFEPLFGDVIIPERGTSGAAGYDVRAHLKDRTIEITIRAEVKRINVTSDRLLLEPEMRVAIPLGFRATLPVGVEAQL